MGINIKVKNRLRVKDRVKFRGLILHVSLKVGELLINEVLLL